MGGECRINLSNQYVIIRCGVQQVVHWEKGTVDICAISLATAIMVNITKNGINETLSRCHVLYITRTHFACRFKIWSQKSNIGSVSCVMGWFVLNGREYGWGTHSNIANSPTMSIANPTLRVLSCTCKLWGRRVFTTVVHIAWVTGAIEITTHLTPYTSHLLQVPNLLGIHLFPLHVGQNFVFPNTMFDNCGTAILLAVRLVFCSATSKSEVLDITGNFKWPGFRARFTDHIYLT